MRPNRFPSSNRRKAGVSHREVRLLAPRAFRSRLVRFQPEPIDGKSQIQTTHNPRPSTVLPNYFRHCQRRGGGANVGLKRVSRVSGRKRVREAGPGKRSTVGGGAEYSTVVKTGRVRDWTQVSPPHVAAFAFFFSLSPSRVLLCGFSKKERM